MTGKKHDQMNIEHEISRQSLSTISDNAKDDFCQFIQMHGDLVYYNI